VSTQLQSINIIIIIIIIIIITTTINCNGTQIIFVVFVFDATTPPVGQGLPIDEVSRHTERRTTFGKIPLDE
jgi:hypothetical protein